MKFFAGKAQPGSETRAVELAKTGLGHYLGVKLAPGTFNVSLMDDPNLGDTWLKWALYKLWPCEVATPDMVRRDEPGLPGWVIRVDAERLPGYFVEIISPHHLRTELKMGKWPSFPVEVGLNCSEQARK